MACICNPTFKHVNMLMLKGELMTPWLCLPPPETRKVVCHACPYCLADISPPTKSKGRNSACKVGIKQNIFSCISWYK